MLICIWISEQKMLRGNFSFQIIGPQFYQQFWNPKSSENRKFFPKFDTYSFGCRIWPELVIDYFNCDPLGKIIVCFTKETCYMFMFWAQLCFKATYLFKRAKYNRFNNFNTRKGPKNRLMGYKKSHNSPNFFSVLNSYF